MPNQSKAYIDTTILVDALLNSGDRRRQATAALASFAVTELPVYAIKEFKAGALANYAWTHNVLVSTKSFQKTLQQLQRMALTPRKYRTATAIQALQTAAIGIGRQTNEGLAKKYGAKATLDSMQYDEFRLSIKRKIFTAWRRRRSVTTHVVHPLSCYTEISPFEERDLIVVRPTACETANCCMVPELTLDKSALEKLKKACDEQEQRPEIGRRSRALRHLIRTPKRPFGEDLCRNLGDAVFAFFCPRDATLLTTNTRDHSALAKPLKKNISTP